MSVSISISVSIIYVYISYWFCFSGELWLIHPFSPTVNITRKNSLVSQRGDWHWYRTFSSPGKSLCYPVTTIFTFLPLSSLRPRLLPLAAIRFFSISRIPSFPECSANGIIHYVFFAFLTQHNSLEIDPDFTCINNAFFHYHWIFHERIHTICLNIHPLKYIRVSSFWLLK